MRELTDRLEEVTTPSESVTEISTEETESVQSSESVARDNGKFEEPIRESRNVGTIMVIAVIIAAIAITAVVIIKKTRR